MLYLHLLPIKDILQSNDDTVNKLHDATRKGKTIQN